VVDSSDHVICRHENGVMDWHRIFKIAEILINWAFRQIEVKGILEPYWLRSLDFQYCKV